MNMISNLTSRNICFRFQCILNIAVRTIRISGTINHWFFEKNQWVASYNMFKGEKKTPTNYIRNKKGQITIDTTNSLNYSRIQFSAPPHQ